MEIIGKSHPDTLIRLGRPEEFEAFTLARVNTENLAERIAAVLDQRRRIGEIRRQREREYLLRKAENPQLGVRKRGELKGSNRQVRELDTLCETVISHNAANEAMNEYGIFDAAENASGSENGSACGNARI